jgi:hypothetical protein
MRIQDGNRADVSILSDLLVLSEFLSTFCQGFPLVSGSISVTPHVTVMPLDGFGTDAYATGTGSQADPRSPLPFSLAHSLPFPCSLAHSLRSGRLRRRRQRWG